ncbi:hypothetical protein Tco_0097597 [Tanacetum coccineum]
MMVAQQELIMVCADNSFPAQHFASQLDAIHSNPKTAVGIFTMARGSPNPFGCMLHPTSDLDEIMVHALRYRTWCLTNMWFPMANECGNIFKEAGIAVDLVNFCLEKEHTLKRLKRCALNAFVAAVNNNENSRIKHLVAGYTIRHLLSRSKNASSYPLEDKVIATMDPELFFKENRKKKSQAAADDEYVKAQGIKYGKRAPLGLVNKFEALTQENEEIASADVGVQRWNNKDHEQTRRVKSEKTQKNQRRAKENVNLIQELEPCRIAKKNQAAAGMEYGKHVPQEIMNKLEALTLENEKLKLENEKLKLELYGKGKGLAG